MLCPKCKTEINKVNVISECWQEVTLDGNKLIDYNDVQIGKTLKIECPKCQANITKYVKE